MHSVICCCNSRGGGNGGGSSSGPNFDPQHMGDRPNPSAYVRDVRGAFQGLPKVKPQWQVRLITTSAVVSEALHDCIHSY